MAHIVIETDRPPTGTRAEVTAISILARVLLKSTSLQTTLRILDRIPSYGQQTEVAIPTEWYFGRAGACLGRQIARSQYLKMRGARSTIVIGAKMADGGTGDGGDIDAHAWLEPLDATSPHPVLHRVAR